MSEQDSDAEEDICANIRRTMTCQSADLKVRLGRQDLRRRWQVSPCMSPSLRHYVDGMKAVQRFKASGGLLPLNLRLSRSRRQLRFPTRLVHALDVGAEPAAGDETVEASADP